MFINHFKNAFRNFRHNKIFSAINVIGLAIGISASLVIFLIVNYEFSFDKFEKDGNRIYRVVTDSRSAGNPFPNSGVPSPLPEAVAREMTGITEIVPFQQYTGDANVTIPKNNSAKPIVFKNQRHIIFTDQHYFNLIPYQWLAGSPKTALSEPFRVVLSEQKAKMYFPGEKLTDIIGKKITYDDSTITTVSGIIKDLSEHTDFIFEEFISLSTIPNSGLKGNYSWDEWGSINSNSQLFVKLENGISTAHVENQFKTLLRKYDKNANKDALNTTVFRLQPMSDIHFNATYGTFGDHTANKPTLYGLLAVAAFLLLLGCINFINLTTAQSSQRAKEIGIRKTMGSSARQLIFQFLTETFFITSIATLISILLTPLLLEVFGDFIPKDLHFDILHQPDLIMFLIVLIIAVSFLSGFYPALVLSKYNPVLILKNQSHFSKSGTRKALLRKSLTVFQFFIAQFFIMATLITVKQIHFMLNTNLGFKKDAIITFSAPFHMSDFLKPNNKRYVLLNELKSIPGIEMLSLGSAPPSTNGWSSGTMKYNDGKKEIETDVQRKSGDTNYINLYHIKLLAGRNVEQSDTTKEYLVNETYMHILGFQNPQDILNKNINGMPIVGVMADFHQQSLRAPIKPLVFSANNNGYIFHVALQHQNEQGAMWQTTIAKIGKAFKQIYPEDDFSYEFFDESIAKFYKADQDISRLLKWATGLAILISCLGLLGLVIFTTNSRTKEIGIRKVLGASVVQITSVLSKDFMKLVLLAFAIATPIAWWATYKWLQDFAYKTKMSWWIFVLSGLAMLLIALITLSMQTIKAARANPVDSLRSE